MINSKLKSDQKSLENDKLVYVRYADHFFNGSRLTIDEIIGKTKNGIILKSFGTILYENEKYLVLENVHEQRIDFILRSAIISQEIYSKVKK